MLDPASRWAAGAAGGRAFKLLGPRAAGAPNLAGRGAGTGPRERHSCWGGAGLLAGLLPIARIRPAAAILIALLRRRRRALLLGCCTRRLCGASLRLLLHRTRGLHWAYLHARLFERARGLGARLLNGPGLLHRTRLLDRPGRLNRRRLRSRVWRFKAPWLVELAGLVKRTRWFRLPLLLKGSGLFRRAPLLKRARLLRGPRLLKVPGLLRWASLL